MEEDELVSEEEQVQRHPCHQLSIRRCIAEGPLVGPPIQKERDS